MLARIIVVAGLCLGSLAQAQICTSQLALSQTCAGTDVLFKAGTGYCPSGATVNANSAAVCADSSSMFSTVNASCQAMKACSPASYSNDFTSKLQPYSISGNLYKLVWVYSCSGKTYTRQVILDKTAKQNEAFFNKYPAPSGTSYVRVALKCTGPGVTSQDSLGNSTISYPEGCYIAASWNATAPYCSTSTGTSSPMVL